jgi:hypothetical protein
VVVQVAEGVANYGVNPTRLAPQAAVVVCAVEQDVWCGWLAVGAARVKQGRYTAIVTTKGAKDEAQNQVTLYSIGLVAGYGNCCAGSIKRCASKSCKIVFPVSSCAAAITDGIAWT